MVPPFLLAFPVSILSDHCTNKAIVWETKLVRGDEGDCRYSLCTIESWLWWKAGMLLTLDFLCCFTQFQSFYLPKYELRQPNYLLFDTASSSTKWATTSRIKFYSTYFIIAKIRTHHMSNTLTPHPQSQGIYNPSHFFNLLPESTSTRKSTHPFKERNILWVSRGKCVYEKSCQWA